LRFYKGSGLAQGRGGVQETDGDQEAAEFAADNVEVSEVFGAAGAGRFLRITSAGKLCDVRGEISCFQSDRLSGAADVNGEAAKYAGSDGRRVCFERERYEDNFERRAISFGAGNIDGSAAGRQIRRRQNHQ
jgi:hypothetical protein